MVFNWLDHTWHNEGTVPFANVSYQACGLIKDPSTGRVNVMVVGGVVLPPPGSSSSPIPSSKVWLWDPATGIIQLKADSPPAFFHEMVQFTDYEVLVLCPQDGWVYSFNVEGGWNRVGQINQFYFDPVPLLVPKDLFRCISQLEM